MPGNLELLRQIQDGAVTTTTSVSELLRRCQVFAARLKVEDLGEWVRHELDGYPDRDTLPDYRIVEGHAKGDFFGAFGRVLRNMLLPVGNLPKPYQRWAQTAYLRQPIATLEEIARSKNSHQLIIQWPADLIAEVRGSFIQDMHLVHAALHINRLDMVSAVEAVRNRTLSFALEAEGYLKESSDSETPATAVALSNVFHTNIYGSVANLAQGSTNVTQSVAGLLPGDLSGLLRELKQLGVADPDLAELRDAIAQGDSPKPGGKPGAKVYEWAGKMISKAMSGAWKIGVNTASEVLPKLIDRYYNMPQ